MADRTKVYGLFAPRAKLAGSASASSLHEGSDSDAASTSRTSMGKGKGKEKQQHETLDLTTSPPPPKKKRKTARLTTPLESSDDEIYISEASTSTVPEKLRKKPKKAKRAKALVIPDSPSPRRRDGFKPMSELFKHEREQRKAAEAPKPRWPSAEEHGMSCEKPRADRMPLDEVKLPRRAVRSSLEEEARSWDRRLADFPPQQPPPLDLPLREIPFGPDTEHSLPDYPPHPLLDRISLNITTSGELSGHDGGDSRSSRQLWSSRYAPQKATEVLGSTSGKSAWVFKEWLSALSLQNAEGGRPKEIRRQVLKPRKGKTSKDDDESDLLDFISYSDDEEEIEEDSLQDSLDRSISKPSTRQIFPFLSNLILLSGPNGSGKTATVHAVAEELGFEVFEVNAGMGRRAAKDVERYVGDVAKNHIVHGVSTSPTKKTGKDAFASFRRPPLSPSKHANGASSSTSEPAATAQKTGTQSLILFEEVDLLYEEEDTFWTGLINLVQTSQRPVVLTCNDPSFVPFTDLCLQDFRDATFRYLEFAPPEPLYSVPFLELAALAVGRILPKSTAEQLYSVTSLSRSDVFPVAGPHHPLPHPNLCDSEPTPDLRKALNLLQFWCEGEVGSGAATASTDPTAAKPNIEVSVTNGNRESSLDNEHVAADALSFCDAYVARRPWVQASMDENGYDIADKSVMLGPPSTDVIMDEAVFQFPILGGESAMAKAITEFASTITKRSWDPDGTQRKIQAQQRLALSTTDALTYRFVVGSAPSLPHPVTFTDYLPYLRLITEADRLNVVADAAGELDGSSRTRGLRRSNRFNGSAYQPRLGWKADEGEQILATGFAI